MDFADLLPGEKVIFKTGLHKIVPVGAACVGLLIVIAAWLVCWMCELMTGEGYYLALLPVSAGAGVLTYIQYLNFKCSLFVVTNKRVLLRTGVFFKVSSEILVNKVEALEVQKDFFADSCGYGTLIVSGTGGSKTGFAFVNQPERFQRNVRTAADAAHTSRQKVPA